MDRGKWGFDSSGIEVQNKSTVFNLPSLRVPGEDVSPLTTACAPPFRLTQKTFLKHRVTTIHPAMIEKGIIRFKHNSRLKFCPLFAKLLAPTVVHECDANNASYKHGMGM